MTYLITGAGGYIGKLIVQHILENCCSENQTLLLLVRNKASAAKIFQKYLNTPFCKLKCVECCLETFSLSDLDDLKGISADYIIHCAAPTDSGYMISNPVETSDTIVLGTKNMLELAKNLRVKSMVYLSSMEVYGQVDDTGRPRGEEELGSIDLNQPRSCYPLAKRMAEHYCHIYYQEYGVPVKIARLAQIFGRGVRLDDRRVFMQFARAAYRGEDIVLHTDGHSMGNYCDASDAVDAIFTIMLKGCSGEAYNVVNEENTMRIKDMAELVAEKIAQGRIRVRVELDAGQAARYAPKTALRLSSAKLRALGWRPTAELEQMYRDVIKEIRNTEPNHLLENCE